MEKNQPERGWNFDRRTVLKSAAASSLAGGVPATAAGAGSDDDRPRGYTGRYFNLSENHPDMEGEITGLVTGMVAPELPLRFTGVGGVSQPDWFSDSRLSFERVDRSLQFGRDFFPVNEGLPGDPFHFTVHWSARIVVPANGTYTFSIASDDDSWVFVDRELTVDNGGVHGATQRSGSMFLEEGEYDLDIYYAERHTTQSAMTFIPDSRVEVFATEGESEFEEVKAEKLALASQVTAVSPTIDEVGRVRPSLSAMEQLVEDDDLEEDRAVEAVERMKLGENVTEALLGGVGPATLPAGEDPETLVGAPAGSPPADPSTDPAGTTVAAVFELLVQLLLAARGLAKLAGSGRFSGLARSALRWLDRHLGNLLETAFGDADGVVATLRSAARETSEELRDAAVESLVTAGSELLEFVTEDLTDVRDGIAELFVGHFEQDRGAASIDAALADLDASLGGGGSGQPSFGGSLGGARQAAADGIAQVDATVADGQSDLDALRTAMDVAGFLSLGASLLAVLTGATGVGSLVSLAVGVAAGVFEFAAVLGSIAEGWTTLSEAAAAHDAALEGVVGG